MATGTSHVPDVSLKTENGASKQQEDILPNRPRNEERTSLLCDPCSSADEAYEAESFCTDCEEFLCAACVKAHKRSKLTKTHCLQKADNMTRTVKDVKESIIYEKCSKHLGQNVEYLCEVHDELCCGDCVQIIHDQCKNILTISDMIDQTSDIMNRQETLKQINNVLYEVKIVESQIRVNSYAMNMNHSRTVEEIQSFRNEIESFFGALETHVKGVAMSKRNANNEIIEDVSKATANIRFEMTAIRNLISKEQRTVNEKYQQFVAVKKTKGNIVECNAKLGGLRSKCSIQLYAFEPDKDLIESLKSKIRCFGRIKNTTPKYPEQKISSAATPILKFSKKYIHKISEITVLNRNILVALSAKSLLFINCKTRKIESKFTVLEDHRSIAKINEQTLCVSVPSKNKLIYVLYVNGNAKELRNVSVVEEYSAICFWETGEQLVCYNDKKNCVDMLDVSATISHTIQLTVTYYSTYVDRKKDGMASDTCIQVIGPKGNFEIFILANQSLSVFSKNGKELCWLTKTTGFCIDSVNVCYCACDSFIHVYRKIKSLIPIICSISKETEFRPGVGIISRIAYCNNTFRLFLLADNAIHAMHVA